MYSTLQLTIINSTQPVLREGVCYFMTALLPFLGNNCENVITDRNLGQTVSKHVWASSPKCFQAQIDFPTLIFSSNIGLK